MFLVELSPKENHSLILALPVRMLCICNIFGVVVQFS